MLTLLIIYQTIISNPYYIGGVVYLIGMFIQLFITKGCLRKRKKVLIEEHQHTTGSLILLWFVSVTFWPVSWWFGIKSMMKRYRDYKRDNSIDGGTEDTSENIMED